jgi:hypothetical protein
LFDRATFQGDARFESANFQDITLFVRATFQGAARFESATFQNTTGFTSATFQGEAGFADAQFKRNAEFSRSKLTGSGSFAARFAAAPIFLAAEIAPPVSFEGFRITGLGAGTFLLHLGSALLLLVLAATAFASLQSQGWLSNLSLAAAIAVALVWFATMILSGRLMDSSSEATAARVLIKISEDNRNHLDYARFFRHQLKAQRLEAPSTFRAFAERPLYWLLVKPIEKLLRLTYEVVADYGLSLIRPIVFLIASVFAFAALVWAWEGGGLGKPKSPFWSAHAVYAPAAPVDSDFLGALSFSAARVFPFGPWGEVKAPDEGKGQCSFAARHLAVDHCRPDGVDLPRPTALEGHRLAVRAVAVVQSILAALLIFLFALAVRRRFQIT